MDSIAHKKKRILSVDVFRGLTIALMILVNSPGTRTPYSFLAHSDWNGCTLADIVFPFFLFIIGLTISISLKQYTHLNPKTRVYHAIAIRSAILCALGLLLNALPNHFHFENFRIYGVLQRISVCYLIASLIYLNATFKTQWFLFFIILLAYFYWMTQIPVPGIGLNQLTPDGSWVSYIDQHLFSSAHLYGRVYDPEGLFSTIPSIATTLSGMLTGHLLFQNIGKRKKLCAMLMMGVFFLSMAWFWSDTFPINKDLWTSSFVLWTSGLALIVFSFCYLIIDILGYNHWVLPFQILGMNALFIFVVHVLLLKVQSIFHVTLSNGTEENLRLFIADYLFGSHAIQNTALLYSLCFLFLNFILASILYRYRIFIKI